MSVREFSKPQEYNIAGQRIGQLVNELEAAQKAIREFVERAHGEFPKTVDIEQFSKDEEWMKGKLNETLRLVETLEGILDRYFTDSKQFKDLLVNRNAASGAHRLSLSIGRYLDSIQTANKEVRELVEQYVKALNIPRHAVDESFVNRLQHLDEVLKQRVDNFKQLLEIDPMLKVS